MSVIKEMKWTPDIATGLTWGQISSINSGLKELDDMENKETLINSEKNREANKKHTEIMVQKLLESKRPDGTVDLNKIFGNGNKGK